MNTVPSEDTGSPANGVSWGCEPPDTGEFKVIITQLYREFNRLEYIGIFSKKIKIKIEKKEPHWIFTSNLHAHQ